MVAAAAVLVVMVAAAVVLVVMVAAAAVLVVMVAAAVVITTRLAFYNNNAIADLIKEINGSCPFYTLTLACCLISVTSRL